MEQFNNFFLSNPFLKDIALDDLKYIVSHSKIKLYQRGQVVYYQHDVSRHLFIVLSGALKEFCCSKYGNEHVHRLIENGECFGEEAILKDSRYDHNVQAISPVQLLEFPSESLKEKIYYSAGFASAFLTKILEQKNKIELKTESFNLLTAPQKIASFILDRSNGAKSFSLPYEKSCISSYLGMKPETFSRAIKKLKEIGLVLNSNKVIIKDIEQLKEFCDYQN